MKPVFQNKFANPALTSTGDSTCLEACVASVLHRDLKSIPEFGLSGLGWFSELYAWCMNEDIGLLYFTEETMRAAGLSLNAYCIMAYTVNGYPDLHAVVGKTFLTGQIDLPDGETKWLWRADIVHDPNRHGVDIVDLKYYIFLIPPPANEIPTVAITRPAQALHFFEDVCS